MKSNERLFFIGGTGSGKTTLAAYMTLGIKNLAVFDVKRELIWLPDSVVVTDVTKLTFRRREVFQPPPGAESDRTLFNEFCRRAYTRAGVMVWVDEASFCTSPQYLPPYLKSILVAGRSRGVGCISLTQSAVNLSNPLLWQTAEHVYIGYLNAKGVDSVFNVFGESARPAGDIAQYSGEFLAYLNNSKTPTWITPINVSALGAKYVRTSNTK